MDTYKELIKAARSLANHVEINRLNLLTLLANNEDNKVIWLKNPFGIKSWPELIEREGLCTARLYKAFVKARDDLGRYKLNKLGVYAAINVSRIKDKKCRNRILKRTFAWIKASHVRPTYQRITEYVRQVTQKPRAKARNYKAEAEQLHEACQQQSEELIALEAKLYQQGQYIRRLKIELRNHGIPVPPPLQS